MIKKILLLLLFIVIVFSMLIFTACGRGNVDTNGITDQIEVITPPGGTGLVDDIEYIPEVIPDPPLIIIPMFDEHVVTLDISPEERTVQGLSRITFTNRTGVPLETIVIRVFFNAFREGNEPRPYFPGHEHRVYAHVREFGYMDVNYVSIDSSDVGFHLDGTVLIVDPLEPIQPNATIQLNLQYSAFVPPLSHRTGGNPARQRPPRSSSMWFGMFLPVVGIYGEDGWYTDLYYPVGTPFFLELANYEVSIVTPIRYTVAGTGLRGVSEVIEDTDTLITTFSAHMVRDFAFAIAPYFNHQHVVTQGGTTIRFYYTSKEIPFRAVMDFAKNAVEYFENRVGHFPLRHISIIETDLLQDMHDSMSFDFSQVIFVDSNSLRQGNFHGLAQGIGNQWFSTVVGSNRIETPWLTEGLTRFVRAGIFYPTYEELRAHIEAEHATIVGIDNINLTDNLSVYTSRTHFAQAQGRRAMVMLYALERRMGEDDFWKLIRQYYQEFSFEIATADDFIRIAEEIYGGNLNMFFNQWKTGRVPPLPVSMI